jgi:hypothetical protein
MNQKVSAQTVIRTAKPSARVAHVRPGVDAAAVHSKMIHDTSPYARPPGSDPYLGNFGYLQEISDQVAGNIEDAINQQQLQPEVEICIQILTALVLSPKDMINTELSHQVQPNILPAEMTAKMIAIVKNYAENDYKIKAMLPDKLRKALFVEGADVTLIIPENSLDDLINGRTGKKVALEEYRKSTDLKNIGKPVGYMGAPSATPTARKMTLESMLNDVNSELVIPTQPLPVMQCGVFTKCKGWVSPEIYDNPMMMKLEDITQSAMTAKQNMVLEGLGGNSYRNIEDIYHNGNLRAEEIFMLNRQEEASRETIGGPLIKPGSTEALMAIHPPGKPDKPIGFIAILDEFGSMISRTARTDYFNTINAGVFNNRSALSGMLSAAASQLRDEDGYATQQMSQQASMAFRDMAARDIESRFMAGSVGNVTVSRQQMAYDLMFERALSGKQTRLVYIPADMVVYWAYRFNDNGTGRSLMEDNKILSSIRALTLFMNVETMIRNSIDHRDMKITIDEDDPNKSRTKEMIVHEYARRRSNSIPWATSNPKRMIEMAQDSGLSVSVEGGDNYPGTKVEIVPRDIQYREIDLSMDESLAKRQTMGYGLAPEIVDLSNQIEFSSKIATSNELSLKRAIIIQDRTNILTRETIIKIVINHQGIMDQLREVVGQYVEDLGGKEKVATVGIDKYVEIFFSIYTCTLPRPDTGLSNRMTELGEYSDALEKLLDLILPDDVLGAQAVGTSSNEWVTLVKASVKSTLVLRYCRENNIMPQLTDMFKVGTAEDYGNILFNEGMENINDMNKVIKVVGLKLYSSALISENEWVTLKERMDTARVEGAEEGEGSSTGGGDDYNDDYGSDDDDGFDFGDDDDDGDGGDFDFDSDSDSSDSDSSGDNSDSGNGDSGSGNSDGGNDDSGNDEPVI